MRTIKFVIDADPYKAGQVVSVDDQVATNSIAIGWAVPSIEEPTPLEQPAPAAPAVAKTPAAAPPKPAFPLPREPE